MIACHSRQTRSKAAAEEIMVIYDHLRVRGFNAHSLGMEILDMVASAAGSMKVSFSLTKPKPCAALWRCCFAKICCGRTWINVRWY